MGNRLLISLFILLIIVSAAACQTGQSKTRPDGAGNETMGMPDFTLQDLTGNKVQLSDFKGKKVMLNFWATWCFYCREEMPLLESFHQKSETNGWHLLTVNLTASEAGKEAVESYMLENNYTFPVLLDLNGEVAALYRIRSIPASFIFDEEGQLIQTKLGPYSDKEIEQLLKL